MPDRQVLAYSRSRAGLGLPSAHLLHEYPNASGVGIEISAEALAVAQENAEALAWPRGAALGDWRRRIGRGTLADLSTCSYPIHPT